MIGAGQVADAQGRRLEGAFGRRVGGGHRNICSTRGRGLKARPELRRGGSVVLRAERWRPAMADVSKRGTNPWIAFLAGAVAVLAVVLVLFGWRGGQRLADGFA